MVIYRLEVLIKNSKDNIGTNAGNDADSTGRCKFSLGLVKTKFRRVREYSPKRSETIKGMGFIWV